MKALGHDRINNDPVLERFCDPDSLVKHTTRSQCGTSVRSGRDWRRSECAGIRQSGIEGSPLIERMSERKAVIKNADMSEDMQQDAVDCASQALEKYNIEKVRREGRERVRCAAPWSTESHGNFG